MTLGQKAAALARATGSFLLSRQFRQALIVIIPVILVLVWILALLPPVGALSAGPAPTTNRPPWVERLGMTGLTARQSPEPFFTARLTQLEFETTKTALLADLCSGKGMKPDHVFREVRQALVRADLTRCHGAARWAAVAPLVVALGPILGLPLTLIVTLAGLALAAMTTIRAVGSHASNRPLYHNAKTHRPE